MIKRFNEWLLENEGQEPKDPQTREEVKALLDEWGVKNWTINDNLTVDVDGAVYLTMKLKTSGFKHIPIKFKTVKGTFSCGHNDLNNLEGLSEGFICNAFYSNHNNLTTLESLPKKFNIEEIWFSHNKISTFEGLPGDFYKIGNIWFEENETVSTDKLDLLLNSMITKKLNWEQVLMKHFKDIPNDDWLKLDMPKNPTSEFKEWIGNKKGAIASKRLGL